MPYRRPLFRPGNYYHIYCRGNEKRDIFLKAEDYEHFLSRMKKYKIIHNISILCYCLMPNHFHLLLRQNAQQPISAFVHRLTVSHSMYFNKHYDRVGHLFQGAFKAKLITDDEYLLHLSRYIHLNPLRSTHVHSTLEKYPWSSYLEYVGRNTGEICDKDIILQHFHNARPGEEYGKFVHSIISDSVMDKLRDIFIELE